MTTQPPVQYQPVSFGMYAWKYSFFVCLAHCDCAHYRRYALRASHAIPTRHLCRSYLVAREGTHAPFRCGGGAFLCPHAGVSILTHLVCENSQINQSDPCTISAL